MGSINDAVKEAGEEVAKETVKKTAKEGGKKAVEKATGKEEETASKKDKAVEESKNLQKKLKDILTTEALEDDIDDYVDHSLNIPEDRGIGRALRGVEAIVGDLNLAVIDIILGIGEYSKNQKKKNKKKDSEEEEEF